MLKQDKIYIAGHRGLVGSAMLRKLSERGYTRLIYKTRGELDLRKQADVERFFDQERPDIVFAAAAKVGGILANNKYKAEFIYDNLLISANIIHASYRFGVKKLLNLGSSCIYPRLAPQPIKEEYLLSGSLEQTNEPYAVAKIAAIKLCRYYNEQYGTAYLSIMPTNLYGPEDNFNLETAHVLPALIRKFHLAKLLKERDFDGIRSDLKKYPLGFGLDDKMNRDDEYALEKVLKSLGIGADSVVLWGSGTPFREFLYVDDLAEAAIFLMERVDYKQAGEILNVGAGEDLTIANLARLIANIIQFEGDITFERTKPDGTPRKFLDISKIKGFGWQPKTGFEGGISETYRWYRQ